MQLWLCPLLAFLLGSIPFGLLMAKTQGIDIRAHGSGNIGATNVLRVMGKKFGIPCLLLDMLKGFIPVAIAVNLIQITGRPVQVPLGLPDAWALKLAAGDALKAQIAHILTALCAVLGHNYSPWVGFKGGKGIATSAGVLLGLMPFAVLLLVVFWLLLFLATRYVSVASMGAAAVLPLLTLWGSWHHGRIQDGTWNKPLFVFTIIIAVLAIWKHRANIQRLRAGTENRFQRKRP
ncbi:MAG: glycerol-3-phosphate 1-O-acyltransferase [Verrucomicrobiaceae bacterium]|nr:MAG: glycerol-3-phosphate 1-O-acyltransferase [Verrucomicrobiaceae bacterium]